MPSDITHTLACFEPVMAVTPNSAGKLVRVSPIVVFVFDCFRSGYTPWFH